MSLKNELRMRSQWERTERKVWRRNKNLEDSETPLLLWQGAQKDSRERTTGESYLLLLLLFHCAFSFLTFQNKENHIYPPHTYTLIHLISKFQKMLKDSRQKLTLITSPDPYCRHIKISNNITSKWERWTLFLRRVFTCHRAHGTLPSLDSHVCCTGCH